VGYKVTGEYMRGREWEFRDPGEPAAFPNLPSTPRDRVGKANQRDYDLERWGAEARVDWKLGSNTEWINTYGITNVASAIELTGANGAGQIQDWRIQSLQSRFRTGNLFAQVFANTSSSGSQDSADVGGTYLFRTGQPIVDQSRVLAAQAQYAFQLGSRNKLVTGVDYIFTNPRTARTINGRNEDDDDATEVGAYVQSTTSLSRSFDLLLAARGDRHSRLDGTFFSPRAALVYKVTDDQNVRLTFNRAYNTPANFSFFLDLLQAANISGLPYNVRAVGNPPETGFTFRRDCTGGVGSLCMRSPFTPTASGGGAQFVPANAAAYYPAALQVAVAGGLRAQLIASGLPAAAADAVIARLGTLNAVSANVGTRLAYITTTPATFTTPDQVRDVEALKASFTNVLEVGYKGNFEERFRLSVDGWWQRRENFITPAANFTPNALLDGPTLGAAIAAHLAPVVGASTAAALAPTLAGALARVPVGTVVPDSRVTTNGDIAFTYQNIDRAIDLAGFDVAFDYLLTDAFSVIGTYSYVSDVVFPEIPSGQGPLTLNAPDHKGSLAFRYDWQPRSLSGEVRGRYQNAFPVNSAVYVTGVDLPVPGQANTFYRYRQPPTSLFLDAQVTWRLPFRASGNGALLSVSGTNLLDRRVPMFAGAPEIGRLIMSRLQFQF
jgi:iron complex outermembrane receptor protein